MKYKGVPIDSISLFKTPALYLKLSFLILIDIVKWLQNFLLRQGIAVLVATLTTILIVSIDVLDPLKKMIWFIGYWIVLGIASSIGLGTGLHTFVLYLGPHIAKVAMIATSCGHLPEMLPSRWSFDHFGKCENTTQQSIGFLGILLAVQIESFLWGFGTAIGQLPPYFVAKKASQTRAELRRMNLKAQGKDERDDEEQQLVEKEKEKHHLSSEEIEEVLQLKRKSDRTLMQRAKIIIYDNMQKYGFFTILLCASIPNPLFDLAGITCGHFRIPFRTFFSATFIGKAIIKVHIQMLFVIAIFRKSALNFLLGLLRNISASISESVAKGFEEQKKILHEPSIFKDNKPLIARLWDFFIIGMVGYFLLSILTGQVQEKAIELQDKN